MTAILLQRRVRGKKNYEQRGEENRDCVRVGGSDKLFFYFLSLSMFEVQRKVCSLAFLLQLALIVISKFDKWLLMMILFCSLSLAYPNISIKMLLLPYSLLSLSYFFLRRV